MLVALPGTFRSVVWKIVAIAPITVLLVICSALSTFANITRVQNPAAVTKLIPQDTAANLNLVDQQLANSPALAGAGTTRAAAVAGLEQNPLNPQALRYLSIFETAHGRARQAKSLADLSERLSRRDLMTQILLIETAVQNGQIGEALVHYNRALLTHDDASELLFPILRGAIADKVVRTTLRPYMTTSCVWAAPFLRDALANGVDPQVVLDLLTGKDPGNRALSMSLSELVLRDLGERREFYPALRYYLTLEDADARLPFSVSFTAKSVDARRAPLAWQNFTTDAVTSTFEAADTPGQFRAHILASAGRSGVALSKVLFLPAGRYTITGVRRFVKGGDIAGDRWQLRCLSTNRVPPAIGDTAVSKRIVSDGERLLVQPGCAVQTLDLFVAGGDSAQDREFTMEQLRISPVL